MYHRWNEKTEVKNEKFAKIFSTLPDEMEILKLYRFAKPTFRSCPLHHLNNEVLRLRLGRFRPRIFI